MAEEVKKIRRRRKKTPEELKGGEKQMTAQAAAKYASHAEDVKKMKAEGLDSVVREENDPFAEKFSFNHGEKAQPSGGKAQPSGKKAPAAKSGTPSAQAAGAKPSYDNTDDPDGKRRSALDSISTFGNPVEEKPSRKQKKQTEPERSYGSEERQQAPSERNTYTEDYIYAEEHKRRSTIIHVAVLLLELIVLGVVLYFMMHYKNLLEKGDFSETGFFETGEESADEEEASEDGETGEAGDYESVDTPSTLDFSNDQFALHCTRLQITSDTDGNPAALIYFTFVNKTDTPLSMSEVFPPMVVQDDIMCETFASIESPPDEFYNRDTQIKDGEGIDVCYSVKLQNTTSPVTLTIHDNYATFEDVASTVINLQ